jgi:catechol 2,3-dioxygenase-like lactoylglutathione lyase family enzyme
LTGPLVDAIDHVVLAVADLDAAVDRYRALGFDVEPGGRHEGFGTRNAIVPLERTYLELLTIEDERRVAASGSLGTTLLELLRRTDAALAGFVVVAPSLDGARAALADDPELLGPIPFQRGDPHREVLRWRLLIPGGTPWRRPWPMFIEWEGGSPHDRRGDGVRHANGARGLVELALEVDDVTATRDWYRRRLAFQREPIVLDGVALQLRARAAGSALGPGPCELCLAVEDLERTAATLASAEPERRDGELVLGASAACGAVLRFREAAA